MHGGCISVLQAQPRDAQPVQSAVAVLAAALGDVSVVFSSSRMHLFMNVQIWVVEAPQPSRATVQGLPGPEALWLQVVTASPSKMYSGTQATFKHHMRPLLPS